MKRCTWVKMNNPHYVEYHDTEWAVPVHDDQKLFEFLVLESAQAGLSWETILKRREGYREAFANFDPKKVARFDEMRIRKLCNDAGIIRNEKKIRSAITNAQAFLCIQKEYGSFSNYLWRRVNHTPIQNKFLHHNEIPAQTQLSVDISKDLKRRGVSFFGPAICYAYMQAIGMVNDHIRECFRYKEIKKLATNSKT